MASSTVNRSINVTASTTGVATELDKIRQRAIELGRDMASQAKDTTNNSQEFIKSLNDQIRLIEKRNKLAKDTELLEAKSRFDKSQTSGDYGVRTRGKDEYRDSIDRIRVSSSQDKLQLDILKDILAAIVEQTREGLQSDRERTIQQIESDEVLAREETARGGEAELRAVVGRRILDDELPEETQTSGVETTAGRLKSLSGLVQETDMYSMGFRGVDRTLDRVATDKDKNSLTRGLAIVGGAIAGFLATSISAAQRQIEARGDLFRATGSESSYGSVKDFTEAETSSRAAQINLALGRRMSNEQMTRLISYERARGIDATQLAQISKYSRGNFGEDRPDIIYASVSEMLDDNNLNQARTSETLQEILQIQQREFMSVGSSHAGNTIRLFNRLLQNQEFADPSRAGQQVSQLDSMVKGASMQQEAVMFSLFQQQSGGGWLEYLEEKQEIGGGRLSEMLISQIMGDSSMTDEDKKYSLTALLKGDAKFAREIFESGGIGGITPGGKTNVEDFERTAGEMTAGGENTIRRSSSWVTDGFADVGESAVNLAEQLVKAGSRVANAFSSLSNTNTNTTHE